MSSPFRKDSWKLFDRISGTYDFINKVLSLGMDQRWRKKLAKFLPERSDLFILDVATGTGDQALCLWKSAPEKIRSIMGIDPSEEMLKIAREKAPHFSTFLAKAEKIPFTEENFDIVSFSFGIRNVEDPKKALVETLRVLKPKGKLLLLEFSMPSKPIAFFYLFYLRKMLPKIGSFLSREKDAYRYLNETIEKFPYGKAFCQMLEDAGYKDIHMHKMNFGTVTLYIGQKP